MSSWSAARAPDVTAWLSCDEADANPVRFWAGFIEASQLAAPGFGADAADLLAMDGGVSPDVTASIANDAAKLPAGSAVVVDDFHYAAPAVSGLMTDLVERWPGEVAQLVLASRFDPALRLHRLRMAGELRGARDPARAARALQVNGHAIAEYFIAEVLDQQAPEIAGFMLDVSVLGTLTAEACAAVTGRSDAAVLLRGIDAASLFLVPLDEERTAFRYHHLVRQLLRTELRARDPAREQALQLRAAQWFETAGDARRAARHFLAARQADQALTLLRSERR